MTGTEREREREREKEKERERKRKRERGKRQEEGGKKQKSERGSWRESAIENRVTDILLCITYEIYDYLSLYFSTAREKVTSREKVEERHNGVTESDRSRRVMHSDTFVTLFSVTLFSDT